MLLNSLAFHTERFTIALLPVRDANVSAMVHVLLLLAFLLLLLFRILLTSLAFSSSSC